MKYGMQFTLWMESRKDCEEWFRWFEGRGVPAAIVKVGDVFAVFRKGIVGRKGADGSLYSIPAPDVRMTLSAGIVASCHGYATA